LRCRGATGASRGAANHSHRGQKAAQATTGVPGTCAAHRGLTLGVTTTPVRRRPHCVPSSVAPFSLCSPTTWCLTVESRVRSLHARSGHCRRPQLPPIAGGGAGGATRPLRGGGRCHNQPRVSKVVHVCVPGVTGPRPPTEGSVLSFVAQRKRRCVEFRLFSLSISASLSPHPPLARLQWGPPHRERQWRRGSLRRTTPPLRPMPGGAASCPLFMMPPARGTHAPWRHCSEAASRQGQRRTMETRRCIGLPLGDMWRRWRCFFRLAQT